MESIEGTGLYPRLDGCADYQEAELPRLAELFGDEKLSGKPETCERYAETDGATYQAMEAFILQP